MEFICKMDKVSVLENKGIYSFKIYSEQEELDSFIIDKPCPHTRDFSHVRFRK